MSTISKEIHFSHTITLNSFTKTKWNIGESHFVEFFPGKSVNIYLYDTNSNLESPLKELSKDQIIYADFKFLPYRMNAPPICLFIFCCSSGVFIFKQTTTAPNLQIKSFMEKKNRKIFVGFELNGIFSRIKSLFGDDFYMNFNCATYMYLPSDICDKLDDIILKYVGKPLMTYNSNTKYYGKWNNSVLLAKDVLYISYQIFAFSLCYPNFNKIKPANEIIKKGKITFTNGLIPRENAPFNIGDSYLVEFFSNTFTPVVLIDANSDVKKYIDIISKNSNVFADFEYVSEFIDATNLIPINVFTFCCKEGVFVFQQTEFDANNQIGDFLRRKDGQKFYTFQTDSLKSKLKKMFGNDFDINHEDVSHTRIENDSTKSICKFVNKYSEGSVVNKGFENAKLSFWTKKKLSIDQILYTAFTAYGLYRCFENFPPVVNDQNDEDNDDIENDDVDCEDGIVNYGQIKFTSDTPLSSFRNSNWKVGGSAEIEFFPGTFSKVHLLDAVTDFSKYEKIIASDKIIFVDLEYLPLFRKEVSPICLFQFCTSNGAFLFRQRDLNMNEEMKKFMSKENGLKFVGKGIGGDYSRLKMFFGDDFEMNIEDIEETRLLPYDESFNFEKMAEKFGGKPTAEFKDKKISCSNWNAKILRKIQVIYSAFDVVALFQCYPHFQPQKLIEYKSPIEYNDDIRKQFIKWAISKKLFNKNDENDSLKIQSFWNEKSNLVIQFLNVDYHLLQETVKNAIYVTHKHQLKCKICRSKVYEYFTFLLLHYRNVHYVNNDDVEQKSIESSPQPVEDNKNNNDTFHYHCDSDKNDDKFHYHCDSDKVNDKFHYHFNNDAKDAKDDNDENIIEIYLLYLNRTGRVSLDNLTCLMCKKNFKTLNALKDHCWCKHYQYLSEIIQNPFPEEN